RANCFLETKHLEAAERDLAKAFEIDAKNPDAFLSRAYLLELQGDLDSAIADVNRAIAGKTTWAAEALDQRGRLLLKKGKVGLAFEDFANATKPCDEQHTKGAP